MLPLAITLNKAKQTKHHTSPSYCSVTLLNPRNSAACSPNPSPWSAFSSRCRLWLSFIVRKFDVSVLGIIGGFVFLSSPQFNFANHLCCLTSLAPLRLPSRVFSSLSSSRVMQSFPALQCETNQHNNNNFYELLPTWRLWGYHENAQAAS